MALEKKNPIVVTVNQTKDLLSWQPNIFTNLKWILNNKPWETIETSIAPLTLNIYFLNFILFCHLSLENSLCSAEWIVVPLILTAATLVGTRKKSFGFSVIEWFC